MRAVAHQLHAGVAQRERGSSRAEVVGSTPAPRSSISGALAAGLALDPASRTAGYNAGVAAQPWRPALGQDWLAYASGFFDGATDRALMRKREAAHG